MQTALGRGESAATVESYALLGFAAGHLGRQLLSSRPPAPPRLDTEVITDPRRLVATEAGSTSSHPALMLPGAANTINHIFGKSAHNLQGLVTQLGSREAAYTALYDATSAVVRTQGTTGLFQLTVNVAGQTVTVRGNVIDGVLRISTAFIP